MAEKMRAMEIRLNESETRLNESETRLTESESRLTVSESRLKDSEIRLNESETRLNESETRLTESETRLTECKTQIVELRNKERPKVAFSAGIRGEAIGPFTTAITLIYRRVITNIGSAYSSSSGVYYFTFSYHAGGEHRVGLHLYKNNELLVACHDHPSLYDTADNGGNAVFVQLQQGDQVFVRLAANTHIWADDAHTTFSGCLVVE
ncbi:Complement C1q-like protein 3 [Liparis tanakae]|uniref:Complement C1q-like protein 3 n=1 Tax=Liparis tanakae TaxID=230148 RepID=A0A4Z2DY27_9TELE|nr:Complement C1q-like protein 3 [Liparis tanakae]